MNPPIICFEGPSAVGKTTLCQSLSANFNIVPEVNLLFARPQNAAKYWYHQRQLDRFEICRKSDVASILDGDVFQPIWYNWACNYPSEFLSKDETHEFYRTQVQEGRIRFPDLYIIFDAEEKALWQRKEGDKTRQRRNFEKHLKIIAPLRAYYRMLDQETDLEMRFVDYTDIESTLAKVLKQIDSLKTKEVDTLATFSKIISWLSENSY